MEGGKGKERVGNNREGEERGKGKRRGDGKERGLGEERTGERVGYGGGVDFDICPWSPSS